MVPALRHAAAFSPAQLFDVWEAVLTGATRDSRQHALADAGDIGQFVDAARRRRGTPCVRFSGNWREKSQRHDRPNRRISWRPGSYTNWGGKDSSIDCGVGT